ncbi:RICIN domain-containing protein, partial [Streptomyces sp. ActVer]|uniref:RICIN domain-containing protein n=1 Tax=Streptomyces sp. ActVer TaxID=3014558 RepID=UPI0022B53D8B
VAAETAGTTVAAAAAEAPVYARLYNQKTGQCLAVPSGSTTNGVEMIQWTCSTSESQYWAFEAVPNGYLVRNLASDKCLAIPSGSPTPGVTPIQWPCSDEGDEQVWTRESLDRLKNKKTGLCLAIPNSSTTDGVKAIQWGCSEESGDQQWLW